MNPLVQALRIHAFDTFYALKKNTALLRCSPLNHIRSVYQPEIAPIGQADSQAPQSMQAPASTTYLPSPSEIAPTGHAPAQLPHDTHASEIVCAIIVPPYQTSMFRYF